MEKEDEKCDLPAPHISGLGPQPFLKGGRGRGREVGVVGGRSREVGEVGGEKRVVGEEWEHRRMIVGRNREH